MTEDAIFTVYVMYLNFFGKTYLQITKKYKAGKFYVSRTCLHVSTWYVAWKYLIQVHQLIC